MSSFLDAPLDEDGHRVRYFIVIADTLPDLAMRVNDQLNDRSHVPQGGPQFDGSRYFQAMVVRYW